MQIRIIFLTSAMVLQIIYPVYSIPVSINNLCSCNYNSFISLFVHLNIDKPDNMFFSNIHYIRLKRIIFAIVLWLNAIQLMTQTNSNNSLSQYLYPEFSQSIVKLKNGQSKKTIMNYNTFTEKMVFEQDNKLMDLIGVELIDTVFMQKNKFVPVGEIFHEVVLTGPISLYIQHKGNIMPAGKPGAYGGTSMTSSTQSYSGISSGTGNYYNLKLPSDVAVKVDPIYWVKKDNDMFSFITKKQFLKIFPDKSVEIKQYIKKNRIKFYNRDHLIQLINYCNKLMM